MVKRCMSITIEKGLYNMSDIRISNEQINKIVDESEIETIKLGEKTTVVQMKLKNGFVITESSSCVDPANYDQEVGRSICISRINEKIWMLEGYRLQCELSQA